MVEYKVPAVEGLQKKSGMDMIIEVNTTKESELLSELGGKKYIEQLSLLSHEGDVRV